MVDIMTLSGRTLGLLLAPGFDFQQDSRLIEDLRLRDADILIVGAGKTAEHSIAGSRGDLIKPDAVISEVDAGDLDALIITGGGSVHSLAMDVRVLTLLLGAQAESRPVAAFGNGPLVLAASGLLVDRRVAAPVELRETLIKAGAQYMEQELVVDHKLVTACTIDEITHFVEAIALLLEPVTTLK